jgi:peptide/nickel transport system permease protein
MAEPLALLEGGEIAEARMRRRQWLFNIGRAVRTRRGIVGLSLMTVVGLIAVVGPFVTPYSATSFQTLPFAKPSGRFLLGGDVLGRDVLSRILDGGWELLLMAAASAAFGVIVGAMSGIAAAYLRGKVDGLIMRTVDVILAFPQLVFALLLVSIVGPKVWLIIVAVGLTHAPQVARVIRSATLDISEREFVKAVELQGTSSARVMVGEILPNLITPLMVEAGLRMTYSIVVIAGLSYLGFGIPPPAPSWGGMISENQIGLASNLWGVVAPAALIAMLTVGTSTFTDAIARVSIGIEARDLLLVSLPTVGEPA